MLLSCAGTYCSHGTRRTSDSAMLEREMRASRGGRSCEAVGGGAVDASGKQRKVAGSGPVKGAMMQSAKRRLAKMPSTRRGDALGLKPKRWTK
jgi:type IV secretory pathway TrbL component